MCASFLNSGDKGKYSGLAVYTESASGFLIRVSEYRDGLKPRGVYLPGFVPGPERREALRRAKSLFDKIRIGKAVMRVTRSGGEDDWWWDDDWWNNDDDDDDGENDGNWWEYNGNYIDIGGGWFEDEAGNLYYDTDGDGIPDSMASDAVVVTPDPEPDPKDDPKDDTWPEEEENIPWEDDDDEVWENPDNTCPNCGKIPVNAK